MAQTGVYTIGIDIGTSYTAAAIFDESAEVLDLEARSASMPSVVYRRDDGSLLVGEAALRRGANDPGSMAVEFKRRFGDDTPLVLGATPLSVDDAFAAVLQRVLEVASERMGTGPAAVALTYPTSWGDHRMNRLRAVADSIGIRDVTLVSEPVAAAAHYAFAGRVDVGETVAVYDLGGGTFDATILRRSASTFETVGVPKGLERMGGADFDHAVLRHAISHLGEDGRALDRSEPRIAASLERLRRESVEVKEALSSDTEATIPIGIPGLERDVRLTRVELEEMVQPSIDATLDSMALAIAAAGVEAADLAKILMVGDSSRMPLVREMVSRRFGRPVLADIHPKHACCLGAATLIAPTAGSDVQPGSEASTEPQMAAEAPVARQTNDVRPMVVVFAILLAVLGILGGLSLAFI